MCKEAYLTRFGAQAWITEPVVHQEGARSGGAESKAYVEGPPGTPYEGFTLSFTIQWPDDYPFKPPIVTIDQPITHPNFRDGGIGSLRHPAQEGEDDKFPWANPETWPPPEPVGQGIELTISYLTGAVRPCVGAHVREDSMVANIMHVIHRRDGTPPGEQRLTYAGKQLKPNRLLKDYNIADGSMIHVVSHLRNRSMLSHDEWHPTVKTVHILQALLLELAYIRPDAEMWAADEGWVPPPENSTDEGWPITTTLRTAEGHLTVETSSGSDIETVVRRELVLSRWNTVLVQVGGLTVAGSFAENSLDDGVVMSVLVEEVDKPQVPFWASGESGASDSQAFESWRHDRAGFLRKASEEMVQITLDADLTRVQQGTQVSPY